ncbi:MAG: bifunctional DNA primase/polymerase [Xanthobacteraceae bacterium]
MTTGPRNALACARRHWYVSPLPPGKKFAPLVGYEARQASAISIDPAQIMRWYGAYSRPPNWAIIPGPSGLLPLDMDVRDGKGGLESLDALTDQYGPLPDTFTVATPSGGRHFYFQGHHRRHIGFRPGLDCPAYLVAPGCALDAGGVYQVINNVPLADAPNWLAMVIGEKSAAPAVEQVPAIELDQPAIISRAIDYLQHDAKPSIEGKGGEYRLLCVAGVLKDMGISMETAIDLLMDHYNERCDPPWGIGDEYEDADRLDVKVRNAWLYLHQTQPGGNTPEVAFADFDPVEDAKDCERMAKLHHDTIRRQYRAAARIPDEDRQS